MIITLTGHRDCDYKELRGLLLPHLDHVLAENPIVASRCGGAPGGDLTFGVVCWHMGIPVHLYLPDESYFDRTLRRYPDWQPAFRQVEKIAADIRYCGEGNDWRNNFARNEEMIRDADLVFVAYRYDDLDRYTTTRRPRKGGTAHGIMTAKRFRRPIVHLQVS